VTFKRGGNPYGVTVTANRQGIADGVQEAILHQARRRVEFAAKIAS
jgi:NAD(P)H dehydrogenase (quinone)